MSSGTFSPHEPCRGYAILKAAAQGCFVELQIVLTAARSASKGLLITPLLALRGSIHAEGWVEQSATTRQFKALGRFRRHPFYVICGNANSLRYSRRKS
jgi:hypothetical protein